MKQYMPYTATAEARTKLALQSTPLMLGWPMPLQSKAGAANWHSYRFEKDPSLKMEALSPHQVPSPKRGRFLTAGAFNADPT